VKLNTIKVDRGDSVKVWVMILSFSGNSRVITALNEAKLKKLRCVLGFNEELPSCSTLSLAEFVDYYPTHPVLNTIKDWDKMGIPVSRIRPECS
jgi:hypothetical protein